MILEFLLLMSLRVLKILTSVDRKYTANFLWKKSSFWRSLDHGYSNS